MARRRFRFDPDLKTMVELQDVSSSSHFINSEATAKFDRYMERNGLQPYDPDVKKHAQPSVAEVQRERQATREMLWEQINKTFSMGNKPRR